MEARPKYNKAIDLGAGGVKEEEDVKPKQKKQ